MRARNVLAEDNLYRFLDEYGNTREKREILLFFGSNSNIKFSKLAIYYALDCSRPKFNRALDVLVEQGVVDISIQNNIPTLQARGVNVYWNYNDTDLDSDGILDGNEDANQNGQLDENETDPCNPDTDFDGMPDGWEVAQNTNPRVDDAFDDNDDERINILINKLNGLTMEHSTRYLTLNKII